MSKPSATSPRRATNRPARATQDRGASRRHRLPADDRAEQILHAAEQLFDERGYAATSMDELAREVGILKGSLYYYVSTKEDLLFRIVENVNAAVGALLSEAEALEATPLQRLLHYVRAQVRHNAGDLHQLAVYYHEWKQLDGDRLEQARRERRKHELRVRALVKGAQEAGEVAAELDPRLAVAHIFAVIAWPYTWYQPGKAISITRLADSVADFIVSGLSDAAR